MFKEGLSVGPSFFNLRIASMKMGTLRSPVAGNGKVIITGPGRSGTTFLVVLLTELGYDTGFSTEQCQMLDDRSHAGLEMGIYKVAHKNSPLSDPYIIKSPLISDSLEWACVRGDVLIEHVFIPLRDIHDIARSRERVHSLGAVAGGLFQSATIEEQEAKAAVSFFNLMRTIVTHGLPCTLLDFPRLAIDPEYLYLKLSYLVEKISYRDFLVVFNRISKPEWINAFRS